MSHLIVKQILIDFDWGEYGLSEMEWIDSDEWADALAEEILEELKAQGYM